MLAIDDILVARDFSSVSDRALRHALDLAARTGATLHLLHADVLHEVETRSDERPAPGENVDAFRDRLKTDGTASPEALDAVPIQEVTRRDVAPAPALLNYADEDDIDLIAMGTHGRRGPSRILLGSVAEEVVRRAPQPVLTVRGEEEEGRTPTPGQIDRLLAPVDFSDYARKALRVAHEWAALYDATVDVLHVVEEDLHPAFYVGGVQSIYDVEPDLDEKVKAKLQEFVGEVLGSTDGVETHVRTGSAPSGITEFVEENDVDLVSLSTHGRTGMERFFLGSVAEKVVRHVSCPVLTSKAFGTSLMRDEAEAAAEKA
jgi:Universal stress protein UspA and related nucleotide-binding proteins